MYNMPRRYLLDVVLHIILCNDVIFTTANVYDNQEISSIYFYNMSESLSIKQFKKKEALVLSTDRIFL